DRRVPERLLPAHPGAGPSGCAGQGGDHPLRAWHQHRVDHAEGGRGAGRSGAADSPYPPCDRTIHERRDQRAGSPGRRVWPGHAYPRRAPELRRFEHMRYISTRGQAPALNFEDVLLAGLASDGGLYVPENLPRFTQEEIASWAGLPYHELAFRVMRPFLAGSIPDADFKKILEDTYGVFAHSAVAPLRQLNGNEWVLELFHGPTLAFKDFALQLLGRLLDYVLAKRNERVVIIGATSGDTGSAAIEGCKACDNVDIFIMHPHNRVS